MFSYSPPHNLNFSKFSWLEARAEQGIPAFQTPFETGKTFTWPDSAAKALSDFIIVSLSRKSTVFVIFELESLRTSAINRTKLSVAGCYGYSGCLTTQTFVLSTILAFAYLVNWLIN